MPRRIPLFLALIACAASCALADDPAKNDKPEILTVRRIWDVAPHSAFTDLVRFKNQWFCTFREDKNHWGPGAAGKIRVIRSADGEKWESAALISGEGDLRDPKLSITPEGKLMLVYFRRFNPHRFPKEDEQTYARVSSDGCDWSEPWKIGFPNKWLWRVSWHNGKAYGVSHGGPDDKRPFVQPRSGFVVVSADGKEFKRLAGAGYGGESTIRFDKDGTAWCLQRGKSNQAYLGKSTSPYDEWTWTDMHTKIGGPDFEILPDGRMIAAVRRYGGKTRTVLCRLDPEKATLTDLLELPSGGDTSYAGLVWHDGLLWVSYYASHEEKTAIYLAKVYLGSELD